MHMDQYNNTNIINAAATHPQPNAREYPVIKVIRKRFKKENEEESSSSNGGKNRCPVCYEYILKHKYVKLGCKHELCSTCITGIVDTTKTRFACPCCRGSVKNMQVATKTLKQHLDGYIAMKYDTQDI